MAKLPVIAMLKMSAWLDNPHERVRDLQDIGSILSDYLTADDDRHWDDERLRDVEFDNHSAFALGLDLDAIVKPHHRAVIERFLAKFVDTETHHFERLASTGRSHSGDLREAARQRLDLVREALGLTLK